MACPTCCVPGGSAHYTRSPEQGSRRGRWSGGHSRRSDQHRHRGADRPWHPPAL